MAVLFDSADVDAKLVLMVGILDEFSLDTEAEQDLQVASDEFHLVQGFGTDLDLVVRLKIYRVYQKSQREKVNSDGPNTLNLSEWNARTSQGID